MAFVGVLGFTLPAMVAPLAHAQTASPQFLVTWHAIGSYVPSTYKGKALPVVGTRIMASVEFVSAQGKLLNLSGQTIYWYLDTNYIGGGVGVQGITFSADQPPPATLDLEVKLPSYNGQVYTHDIDIPLVDPMVVIYAPYPNGQFSGTSLDVQALPYFFNTTSTDALSYAWSADGQPGTNTENPNDATIAIPQGTPSGTSLSLSVTVKNPLDSTVATANTNLTYNAL
jgi:hypothetical protein